jgi:hypothetical protein
MESNFGASVWLIKSALSSISYLYCQVQVQAGGLQMMQEAHFGMEGKASMRVH